MKNIDMRILDMLWEYKQTIEFNEWNDTYSKNTLKELNDLIKVLEWK